MQVTPPKAICRSYVHNTLLIIIPSFHSFSPLPSLSYYPASLQLCPSPANVLYREHGSQGVSLPSERLVALARRKPHASPPLPFFITCYHSYIQATPFPFPFSRSLPPPTHSPPLRPSVSVEGFRLLPTLYAKHRPRLFPSALSKIPFSLKEDSS